MNRMVNKGKIVYYINGQRFENDHNKRNGKDKAIQYCLDNFLNTNDIKKFDSRTECSYYEYLLELQEKGLVKDIIDHFKIKIQDEYVNSNGDTIPAIVYESDFIYTDTTTNKKIIIDIKGSEYFIDERFITIKQVFDKLMLNKGLYLKIVLYRNKEWVEYKLGDTKKSSKLLVKKREQLKEAKKLLHEKELEENKRKREIDRLMELRAITIRTKSQQKRLEELESKYGI